MNLGGMRVVVRCDLNDEDSENYRWFTDRLDN